MSSPCTGQSHSDLGHSDTLETHEESPVTSDEHHGAQYADHGGDGDHDLGLHSHGPGDGTSGWSSGRALP